MVEVERIQCQALTKAGTQCKNVAQPGARYCHIHIAQAQTEEAPSAAADQEEAFRQMVAELNELAEELRRLIPEYSPPPYSREGLLRLLRDNIDRMTPAMRLGLLRDLQSGLRESSPRDFLDPDTWRGMWYLLNYSLQNETAAMKERLAAQLARLPGAAALSDFQGMFQGASPRDLLEIETWRGMWYLLNYTLQNQVDGMRRRVLGDSESAEAEPE